MYSEGNDWVSWMRDYRFGTMVFLPSGEVRHIGDKLRWKYDPESARGCAAHITVTQPFAEARTPEHLAEIERLLANIPQFKTQIGPATTSPNRKLVWFDVSPKESVLNVRELLHQTGFFRTDLPLTKGFIPHLTISEAQREPDEVQDINDQLNSTYQPWEITFDSVSWIIPDDDCNCREHQIFRLRDI